MPSYPDALLIFGFEVEEKSIYRIEKRFHEKTGDPYDKKIETEMLEMFVGGTSILKETEEDDFEFMDGELERFHAGHESEYAFLGIKVTEVGTMETEETFEEVSSIPAMVPGSELHKITELTGRQPALYLIVRC